MRLNVMLEPQEGMSYQQILAVARRAEHLGFDGCYRSDHYSTVGGGAGLASTDAWATLGGLARETERIVLGTLVSPATFRPAGNLAKVVATVAEMAGQVDGRPRIHLGLGTGWMESEHRQHGFPFEDMATRFRRLDEHLQILHGLWDPDADTFDFDGEFARLDEARFRPKPVPRPRIIVGGTGRVKTPRLAARYADELNVAFRAPEQCREARAALDRACEEAGRDPASIPLTLMTGCVVGADAGDFRARAQRLHERSGSDAFDRWLAELESNWIIGEPEQALDRLGTLAEAGVEAVMLQHQLFDDLDMLDAIAKGIAPRL